MMHRGTCAHPHSRLDLFPTCACSAIRDGSSHCLCSLFSLHFLDLCPGLHPPPPCCCRIPRSSLPAAVGRRGTRNCCCRAPLPCPKLGRRLRRPSASARCRPAQRKGSARAGVSAGGWCSSAAVHQRAWLEAAHPTHTPVHSSQGRRTPEKRKDCAS